MVLPQMTMATSSKEAPTMIQVMQQVKENSLAGKRQKRGTYILRCYLHASMKLCLRCAFYAGVTGEGSAHKPVPSVDDYDTSYQGLGVGSKHSTGESSLINFSGALSPHFFLGHKSLGNLYLFTYMHADQVQASSNIA